jgi:hypothetical protein
MNAGGIWQWRTVNVCTRQNKELQPRQYNDKEGHKSGAQKAVMRAVIDTNVFVSPFSEGIHGKL